MALHWSQFYHHCSVYIEKNTERFRSNSFNRSTWEIFLALIVLSIFHFQIPPPYCPGICLCFIFSLLSFCPPILLSSSSSQTSLAILPSQAFSLLLYPFNLRDLGKFSIYFHIPHITTAPHF